MHIFFGSTLTGRFFVVVIYFCFRLLIFFSILKKFFLNDRQQIAGRFPAMNLLSIYCFLLSITLTRFHFSRNICFVLSFVKNVSIVDNVKIRGNLLTQFTIRNWFLTTVGGIISGNFKLYLLLSDNLLLVMLMNLWKIAKLTCRLIGNYY